MRRHLVLALFSCAAAGCSVNTTDNPFDTPGATGSGSVIATITAVGMSNVDTTPYAADFFNGVLNLNAGGTPGGIRTSLVSSMSPQGTASVRRILDVQLLDRPEAGAAFDVTPSEATTTSCTVTYDEQMLDPLLQLIQDPTWAASSGTITIDGATGPVVTFHGDVVLDPGASPMGGAAAGPAAEGQVKISITGRFDGVKGL